MSTSLRDQYEVRRLKVLLPLAAALELHLKSLFEGWVRIDRINVRVKNTDRFIAKAAKTEAGAPKYSDPLQQIQDQIGARIIGFFRQDIDEISTQIEKYFRAIGARAIVPESVSEFGYEGKHFVLLLPRDVFTDETPEDSVSFFELQLRTLLQHAWSEAEHDLGYKPTSELNVEQRRKLALTAAQAWGADNIFEDLHRTGAS